MKRFYPFGRGKRGSRQRVVIEFAKWGGTIRVYDAKLRVLRTHAPDLNVLVVGYSIRSDSRRVFFTSQIFEGLRTGVRAIKDFRKVRRVNLTRRAV